MLYTFIEQAVYAFLTQLYNAVYMFVPSPFFRSSRPLSHCESLFPLLQPTIFWLANALELHHLLSQSYNLSPSESQSTTQQTKNPITILHDILVYTFQQMFYTVSKVHTCIDIIVRECVHGMYPIVGM